MQTFHPFFLPRSLLRASVHFILILSLIPVFVLPLPAIDDYLNMRGIEALRIGPQDSPISKTSPRYYFQSVITFL